MTIDAGKDDERIFRVFTSESEGIAHVAPALMHGGLPTGYEPPVWNVRGFLQQYAWSPPFEPYAYGIMLYTYIHGRFGTEGLRKAMTGPPGEYGPANTARALGMTTSDLLRDWALATVLDGRTSDPRYNYATIEIGKDPIPSLNCLDVTQVDEWTWQYGLGFYTAQQPGIYRLTLTPEGEEARVSVVRVRLPVPAAQTNECFIATASFGSKSDPTVLFLSQVRDRFHFISIGVAAALALFAAVSWKSRRRKKAK